MSELTSLLERSRMARNGHTKDALEHLASLGRLLERGEWYETRDELVHLSHSVHSAREWNAVATQLSDVDSWVEPTVSVLSDSVGDSRRGEYVPHPDFWDCDCERDYIRNKRERECLKCGAQAIDQPDSYASEVDQLRWSDDAVSDSCVDASNARVVRCGTITWEQF